MKFKIEFDCDNAVFEETPLTETSRLLVEVSKKVRDGRMESCVIDYNGNKIGKYFFIKDSK